MREEIHKGFKIKVIPADPDEDTGKYVFEILRDKDCVYECSYGQEYNSEEDALKEAKKIIFVGEPQHTVELSESQKEKFKEWQKSFGELPHIGATGGHFSIEVIYTSIGEVVYGKAWNGQKIDLTEDLG